MKIWTLKVLVLMLALSFSLANAAARDDRSVTRKLDRIMEKLDTLETRMEKLDTLDEKLNTVEANTLSVGCDIDRYLAGECDKNPATATASFCISQSVALELGLEYAIEAPLEIEVGPGWAEVGDVKLTLAPSLPFPLPVFIPPPPLPPVFIPLPTSVGIGAAGDIGRGMDICIEIPILLSLEDTARLAEVARDMNTPGILPTTKFQRRAHRLVAFADRKAGLFDVSANNFDMSANNTETAVQEYNENEFDDVDNAFTELLNNGWSNPGEPDAFSVFRDGNVNQLLATLDLPTNVSSFLNDPEQILDAMPDVPAIGQLTCNDFGIGTSLRTGRPGLDKLCTTLENLPDFEKLRDGLARVGDIPDDIIEAITDILAPLLNNLPEATEAGETVEQTKQRAKQKFCLSGPGSRRIFDNYCGR